MLRMFAVFSLSSIIMLIAVTASAQSQQIPPKSNSTSISGHWTLINLAYPNDKRQIGFETKQGSYYISSDNQRRDIRDVIYRDGVLYFKVPDLQLYFQMRRVGDRFDGKMTRYGNVDRRAPEAVRMTKN